MQFRIISLALCFISMSLLAQKRISDPIDSVQMIQLRKPGSNTPEYRRALASSYQKRGYLLAQCDSIGLTEVKLTKGPFLNDITLSWPEENLQVYHASDLVKKAESWIELQENSGYPYAEVAFKLKTQTDSSLFIEAFPEKGIFYTIDSMFYGNTHFSSRFVKWSSRLKMGDVYHQQKINTLSDRISTLEGISVNGEPELKVENGLLKVHMPVVKTNKDYLSGLVGLATNPTGQPVITGEAMGRFYNMFGVGVFTGFEWRSFKARSQELKIQGMIPYLFGTPFVFGVRFEFEKYDTLFSNISRGLELKLPIKQGFSIKLGLLQIERLRIFSDINAVQFERRLPENPASRNTHYQLGMEWKHKLQLGLPNRGSQITFNVYAGQRKLLRDASLESITWINSNGQLENIYDSLNRLGQLSAANFKFQGMGFTYLKIKPWMVLKLAAEGSLYYAPQVYFNEMERYGGIKNIRGFNEQSIFANQFVMATSELRFQNANAGYIGPFYQWAWFNNQSQSLSSGKGVLQGLGLTTAINTGAGIVKISWALGKMGQQGMALNQSKFHIGVSTDF